MNEQCIKDLITSLLNSYDKAKFMLLLASQGPDSEITKTFATYYKIDNEQMKQSAKTKQGREQLNESAMILVLFLKHSLGVTDRVKDKVKELYPKEYEELFGDNDDDGKQ